MSIHLRDGARLVPKLLQDLQDDQSYKTETQQFWEENAGAPFMCSRYTSDSELPNVLTKLLQSKVSLPSCVVQDNILMKYSASTHSLVNISAMRANYIAKCTEDTFKQVSSDFAKRTAKFYKATNWTWGCVPDVNTIFDCLQGLKAELNTPSISGQQLNQISTGGFSLIKLLDQYHLVQHSASTHRHTCESLIIEPTTAIDF